MRYASNTKLLLAHCCLLLVVACQKEEAGKADGLTASEVKKRRQLLQHFN